MTQWYARVGDKQYGPVEQEEFFNWIAEGRVKASDLVWNQTIPQWKTAAEMFPTTFAGAPAPSAYQPEPYHYVEPHRGGMILTFGIIGVVCCVIFGIMAWVMGSGDLEKMAAGRMDRAGESTTRAGKILGIVSVILAAVGIIAGIFMAIAGESSESRGIGAW